MKKIFSMLMIFLIVLSMFLNFAQNVKAETISNDPILYAGGSNLGVVYKYVGGTEWEVISPELGYAVLCLVEYDGHLYAGTTSAYGGSSGIGRVYRYDGGTTWTLVGDNMDHDVCSLAVYQGHLYAGTAWNGMKLYRYEGDTSWTQVIDSVVWSGTRSLYVSHDYLLMGDIGWDWIGHWDGSTFHQDQPTTTGCCIYDFEDYGDYVYAGAYTGRLWRSTDAIHWSVVLGNYDGNMWELEEFQDKLYMSYNNGELRTYDGTGSLRGELVYSALDGIISMTTDGDYLYFGTGGDAVGHGPESNGTASVYRYDGTDVVLISGEDEMVTGVQVLYTPPVASKILPVPYYYQGDTSWCVPTSMSMIFKYYGQNIHPWDIAKDWGWGRDDYRVMPWTVSDCFKDYGLTTDMCIVTASPPSFQSIRDWIDKDMPILLSMNSIDHAVVIVGYDIIGKCKKVYINDPSSALVNTEMGLSESYPYVAIEVEWNELACYINPLSYLITVGGTPQPSEGTIDLFQTFNYKAVCFGQSYRGQWSGIYSWYASDRGLIWECSEDHALSLNSRDQFQYRLCFANHMKDKQVYLFEIEFAKYEESLSTWIPASVICLPISIDGYKSTSKISHLISLGDLLKEYGEYKLTLRLWDNRAPELLWDEELKCDEVVFPSINYSPLIEFYLCSAADLYITDPQGLHVGVDPSTGVMVNEIPGAIYTGPGSDPQVIAIPDPLDGHYEVQLIGTATGIYSVTTELITLQETITQAYTGETFEGAVYVYSVTIGDEAMTSNRDPIAELEHLIARIERIEAPEKAQKELDKAVKELNKTKEEFDKGDTEKAIAKITKAVKHLMKAQEKGADTQHVIDNLVALVKAIVHLALEDAVEMVGVDHKHVVKAQKYYDKALDKLSEGKYDKAIKEFKKAYKEAMKAREDWVPEPFPDMLEERIAEVQKLQTEDISPKALGHLENAEMALDEALVEANDDKLDMALDKVKKAIEELETAMDEGADTTDIIESLVENTEDTVHEKIKDAEYIASADNKDVVKAWEKFDEAVAKSDEGDYDKAIDLFKGAAKKAEDALL